jgi:hypothetical protein
MGITTAMCNSFKTELLGGVHDLDSDSIKLALIKAVTLMNLQEQTTVLVDRY